MPRAAFEFGVGGSKVAFDPSSSLSWAKRLRSPEYEPQGYCLASSDKTWSRASS